MIDDVTYIDVGPGGQQYSNVITRDNCETPQFYCDRNSTQCVPTKTLGVECTADRECQTVQSFHCQKSLSILPIGSLKYNCGAQGTCTDPPEMPLHVSAWQYVITAISVLAGALAVILVGTGLDSRIQLAMGVTIVTLILLHKRLRLRRYREIREYYEEQMR